MQTDILYAWTAGAPVFACLAFTYGRCIDIQQPMCYCQLKRSLGQSVSPAHELSRIDNIAAHKTAPGFPQCLRPQQHSAPSRSHWQISSGSRSRGRVSYTQASTSLSLSSPSTVSPFRPCISTVLATRITPSHLVYPFSFFGPLHYKEPNELHSQLANARQKRE